MREALVYAVGVAISPVPIASMLLVLTTTHAQTNGAFFAGGWVAGLGFVAILFVLVVERSGISDSDPLWIAVPELAIGLAFLAATVTLLVRSRRRAADAKSWVVALDRVSRAGAAGLGAFLSAANPKVVALALGAALSLAEADASTSTTASTVALFTAIGTTGVALPLALAVAFPARASHALSQLRSWLERNEHRVLIVLGLVISAAFLRDGLSAL